MGRIASGGTVIIFTLLALMFTAVGYMSHAYKVAAAASQDVVEHTYQVLNHAHEVLVAIEEADAGARGYVISGSPRYRSEFESKRDAIPGQLDGLARLTSDNPTQLARIDGLRGAVSRRMAILAEAINNPTVSGEATRQAFAPGDNDQLPLQAVHDLVDQIIDDERGLLARRTAAADEEEWVSWVTYYTFVGATGAAILAVLVLLLRAERRTQAAEARARQSQKMEAIGQLTGGVAHDFNNLLQIILTNLDLALNLLGRSHGMAGYLKDSVAAAEQGARLTGQLLAFARRHPLQPEPLRTDRLVRDMTGMLRRVLGEGIQIEMVEIGGLWTALADPNQVQNALLNLAINARDAMPSGGKLTIELANVHLDAHYALQHQDVKAGQYVMLAVTDTGTGMSTEVVERAFEPFFTTKPEGSGTGLGLSSVYGFAKQSGGHVKIYSEPGQGTTIKLYLPRTQQGETARRTEAERLTRGNGETVLVVEDDDAVRAGVVNQLAELGYRVLAAPNGDLAYEFLTRGEKIDLLFTDVVMPGTLNGRGLAEKAKALLPGLPVLFTSGYTVNAIVHHGRLDEGVMLLSKPYRLPDLTRAIRSALDQGAKGSPAAIAGGVVEPAGRPTAEPTVAGADCQPPRPLFLLVEDEALLRQVMTEALDVLGYETIATGTAADALALLGGPRRVDLLLTDVKLPDMNGLALARESLRRHPDLQVIIATGTVVGSDELPSPAVTVLTKPYRPEQLRLAVEAALRRQAAIRPAVS